MIIVSIDMDEPGHNDPPSFTEEDLLFATLQARRDGFVTRDLDLANEVVRWLTMHDFTPIFHAYLGSFIIAATTGFNGEGVEH